MVSKYKSSSVNFIKKNWGSSKDHFFTFRLLWSGKWKFFREYLRENAKKIEIVFLELFKVQWGTWLWKKPELENLMLLSL